MPRDGFALNTFDSIAWPKSINHRESTQQYYRTHHRSEFNEPDYLMDNCNHRHVISIVCMRALSRTGGACSCPMSNRNYPTAAMTLQSNEPAEDIRILLRYNGELLDPGSALRLAGEVAGTVQATLPTSPGRLRSKRTRSPGPTLNCSDHQTDHANPDSHFRSVRSSMRGAIF